MTTRMMQLAVVVVCLGLCAAHASAQTAAAAAGGTGFTCALTSGGGVMCWGQNNSGQIGDGTTTNRPTPTPVSGLSSGVLAVATGQSHACALTSGGAVLCWGANFAGQLGDGTTTIGLTPTPVTGLASGVLAISAGNYHMCAVTSAGAAKCWGATPLANSGTGRRRTGWTPAPVSGLSSSVLVDRGGLQPYVRRDGGRECEMLGLQRRRPTRRRDDDEPVDADAGERPGERRDGHRGKLQPYVRRERRAGPRHAGATTVYGQLGDGTTTNRLTQTPVSGLGSGVLSIAADYVLSCAVTTGGAAACWGYNYHGQLGDGTMTNRSTPTPVGGLSSGVSSIAAGQNHACAVTTGGDVKCWGSNASGELGDGTTLERLTPTPVSSLGSGVASIVAGGNHACTVTTGGAARCWGFNTYGQLGDGTTTTRLVPTPVIGLGSDVTAIAVGSNHTCALTTGGAVRCWGYNSYGQLGDGTTTNRSTPTQVAGWQAACWPSRRATAIRVP